MTAPLICPLGPDDACLCPLCRDGVPWDMAVLVTDEGHETTLAAFVDGNAETLNTVASLAIGETHSEPGGGSAAWSVTRVASAGHTLTWCGKSFECFAALR
jgi:hypothetical protein